MSKTIGERITDLRKEKGITQLQLANLLNISDKAVSKWESNKCDPSIDLLVSISNIFDCTLDYLIKGDVKPIYKESAMDSKTRAMDLFLQALPIIKTKIQKKQFDFWIAPLKAVNIVNNTLVLSVKTDKLKEEVKAQFNKIIYRAVNKIDSTISNIHFSAEDFVNSKLMKAAVKSVIKKQHATISSIQRDFGISFPKAGRIIDEMEYLEYISAADENFKRKIYIDAKTFEKIYGEPINFFGDIEE